MLAQPDSEPGLWNDYLQGALQSYEKHGVEAALDLDSFRDGRDTTLFYTALDDSGKMLGGLRAKARTCAPTSRTRSSNGRASRARRPSAR